MGNTNGAKWLRRDKNIALKLRANCECAYCGMHMESGDKWHIDHIEPRSATDTPNNHETNLVLACAACNVQRKDMPVQAWAEIVASQTGQEPAEILARIAEQTSTDLAEYRKVAKELLGKLGSYANVMQALTTS